MKAFPIWPALPDIIADGNQLYFPLVQFSPRFLQNDAMLRYEKIQMWEGNRYFAVMDKYVHILLFQLSSYHGTTCTIL